MASELRQGCDYSLFKKGIRPMWEDARNFKGGRWMISLDKKQREHDLDNFWLEIVSYFKEKTRYIFGFFTCKTLLGNLHIIQA